ncbi:hypothetical protein MMC28_010631 [Mycoblastus sanguinarius]|nr:hypothetical protein [Mycoblastus sanguinarius]
MALEDGFEQFLTTRSGEDDIDIHLSELKKSSRVFVENETVRGVEPDEPLLELLVLYRRKQASDPRDEVFGLLGLSNIPSGCHPGLTISYKRTAEDIYFGVVQALVEIYSTLDVFYHCYTSSSHENGTLNLPSCTPNWSIQRNGISHKLEDRSDNNAARDSLACREFLENWILHVPRFGVGLVKRCEAAVPDGRAGDDALENSSKVLLPVWEEWLNVLQQALGNPSKWQKQFSKTVFCGRFDDDETLAFTVETFNAYQSDFADMPAHLISKYKMIGDT